jgi:hypothetical protein
VTCSKNVLHAVVGNDEAEALADIEPFDLPGDLEDIEACIIAQRAHRLAV